MYSDEMAMSAKTAQQLIDEMQAAETPYTILGKRKYSRSSWCVDVKSPFDGHELHVICRADWLELMGQLEVRQGAA